MRETNNTGFIKAIILVIIALLILKFGFDFDVINYVTGEEFQRFASSVWNAVTLGWSVLIDMILRLWNWIMSFFGT